MKKQFLYLVTILVGIFNLIQCKNKIICIVGPHYGYNLCNNAEYFSDKIKSQNKPGVIDGFDKPFVELRKKLISNGYKVIIVDKKSDVIECDYILSFYSDPNFIKNFKHIKAKKILVCLEPPMHISNFNKEGVFDDYDKVLLLMDRFVDNKKFRKIFYPTHRLNFVDNLIPFKEKKFCTLISHGIDNDSVELYVQRLAAIKFFEKYHPSDFEFYGRRWKPIYKTYKGVAGCKVDLLKNYKFCICYENSEYDGYITEKIFDCMASGCIPVYWGAPNIEKYIPSECFIDKKIFSNYEDLYQFLLSIDENKYCEYLNNIGNFFNSSKAEIFSIKLFIKKIVKHLN